MFKQRQNLQWNMKQNKGEKIHIVTKIVGKKKYYNSFFFSDGDKETTTLSGKDL